jgi:Zn finger protein HypA/HybF involved in hydrogenase expression
MHEWGITQSLVDEIKKLANANNIQILKSVEITLGKKAELSELALKTCFKALIEDNDLKSCKLKIIKTSGNELIISKITGEQK